MKAIWELKEKSNGELKVTIDGEQWKKAQDKAFHKVAAKVKINGFREGQAPEPMVRKVINQKELLLDAVEDVANEALLDGVKEYKLELVDRPMLDIESITEDSAVLIFKCTVSPEVKLGKYTGVEYKKEVAKVTAAEIKAQLENIQKNYTEQVAKEDGIVEKGNTAVIDYEGFKDDIAFEGGKGTNYALEIGSNTFIPGFEDQLIGMKVNEQKDVNVTFPADYQEKSLAGQPVVFKVKVNEVKQNIVPELNDDLAKDLDQEGVSTLKDLEKKIKDQLMTSKEKEVDDKKSDELLKKVVEGSSVELPQVMIDEETTHMVNDFKNQLAQQGIQYEQYQKITGQDEKAIREHLSKNAPERVKTRLVLAAIAKEEKLDPSDEDAEKEYSEIATQYGMELAKVKQYIAIDDVKYDLKLRNALNLIKDKAVAKEKDA